MLEFVLYLAMLLLALILYLIFGRNKRELSRIPQGMDMFGINPMMRYVLYALGIFMLIFVLCMVWLCYMGGGFEEAGGMMVLCVCMAVVLFVICLVGGHVMYASHIFFDDECLIIGRAFRAPIKMTWQEIRRMELRGRNQFRLYDQFGDCCVKAYRGNTVNYERFYQAALRQCRPYMG